MKLHEPRPGLRKASPAEIAAYARRAKGDPPEKSKVVELVDLDVLLVD